MFKHWNNRNFDRLYPKGQLRDKSRIHWTPVQVAMRAATFLSNVPDAKILDIGSGCGKFGLTGAYHNPDALFFGIEQREQLVDAANSVKDKLQLHNVEFVSGNFLDINLSPFTGLYFFNSFYENNPDVSKCLDDGLETSEELYVIYTLALIQALRNMPIGTRLVTYFAGGIVPDSYDMVGTYRKGRLKFWEKNREQGDHPSLGMLVQLKQMVNSKNSEIKDAVEAVSDKVVEE